MEKSGEAFRTISEVAELLDTPAHVLRFWESRFSQIKPVKRAGGRRYYRPADVELIGGIKKLLHGDGLTIRGVQKILREQGIRHVAEISLVTVTGADGRTGEVARANKSSPKAEKPKIQPTSAAPWPAGSEPDPAPSSETLRADPDDIGPEAPMDVDVPTLPVSEADNVLPLGMPEPKGAGATASPSADPVDAENDSALPTEGSPAASMLRAMDTLRAREKKAELLSVYLRLTKLRDRVAQASPNRRD